MRRVILLRARFQRTYEERERLLAYYAPLSLILLPMVWLTLVVLGHTAMFWGLGVHPLRVAFKTTGSSVTTLGFTDAPNLPSTVLAFTEAAVGLALLAPLITYLPTMYAAFSRREALVSLTATYAGTPPSGTTMLERFSLIRGLDDLEDRVWEPWLLGFIDIEETHTSLGALAPFRSPSPSRSWVTAAGSVLDAASLLSSSVEAHDTAPAQLCIRAGTLSLRAVSTFFGIDFDPDPRRTTFSGWRVYYDTVLLAPAGFTQAPFAPLSSDRSPATLHRPPALRARRRSQR